MINMEKFDELDRNLTLEQFNTIEKKLDEAQNDDTPYLVATDDEMIVMGDANLTEIKMHDFKMKFIFPSKFKDAIDESDITLEKDGFIVTEEEYKDVFIDPRKALKLSSDIAMLQPFFKKLNEDGSITELGEEERIGLLTTLSDDIVDALYRIAGRVLDIPENMQKYMAYGSVFEVVVESIDSFPGDI